MYGPNLMERSETSQQMAILSIKSTCFIIQVYVSYKCKKFWALFAKSV
jgi:hypothetical protein